MADLTTYATVDSEIAATCDYDTTNDVSKARRFIAAIRRKLTFASSSGRDTVNIQFQHQVLRDLLDQAIDWLQNNDDVNQPSVVHADFSNFGPYSGDYR